MTIPKTQHMCKAVANSMRDGRPGGETHGGTQALGEAIPDNGSMTTSGVRRKQVSEPHHHKLLVFPRLLSQKNQSVMTKQSRRMRNLSRSLKRRLLLVLRRSIRSPLKVTASVVECVERNTCPMLPPGLGICGPMLGLANPLMIFAGSVPWKLHVQHGHCRGDVK